MCYHQARSARFIGHCWGRGWRDATENLLQTSIISRLGSFSERRICGMRGGGKSQAKLLFLCARGFRWRGQWCVGEGWRSRGKNKQTKTQAAEQVERTSHFTTPEKVDRGYFFFVLKTRANPPLHPPPLRKRQNSTMAAYDESTLLYKRNPREAFIRENGCATFTPSME